MEKISDFDTKAPFCLVIPVPCMTRYVLVIPYLSQVSSVCKGKIGCIYVFVAVLRI